MVQAALIGVAVGFGTILADIAESPQAWWSCVVVAVLIVTMGLLAQTRQITRCADQPAPTRPGAAPG